MSWCRHFHGAVRTDSSYSFLVHGRASARPPSAQRHHRTDSRTALLTAAALKRHCKENAPGESNIRCDGRARKAKQNGRGIRHRNNDRRTIEHHTAGKPRQPSAHRRPQQGSVLEAEGPPAQQPASGVGPSATDLTESYLTTEVVIRFCMVGHGLALIITQLVPASLVLGPSFGPRLPRGRSAHGVRMGVSDRMATDGQLYDGWGAEGMRVLNRTASLQERAHDTVTRYDAVLIVAARAKQNAYENAEVRHRRVPQPFISGASIHRPRPLSTRCHRTARARRSNPAATSVAPLAVRWAAARARRSPPNPRSSARSSSYSMSLSRRVSYPSSSRLGFRQTCWNRWRGRLSRCATQQALPHQPSAAHCLRPPLLRQPGD